MPPEELDFDNFVFTKEDPELMGSISIRDPLGLQVLWSAMGRKLIPHLTEQTTRVEAFQLLITIFYLHKKFEEFVEKNFDECRPRLKGRSVQQTFGLQNFFFFAEQAFAHVYYKQRREWNLPGRRQVVALADDPKLSEKRPIMRAQLSTGIWGLYRGAAIRAELLNETGMSLSAETLSILSSNPAYDTKNWRELFKSIFEAMLEGESDIPTNGNSRTVQSMVEVLDSLPEKKLLRKHLLHPPDGPIVQPLSEWAAPFLNKADDLRALFSEGRQKFMDESLHFANIITCEDFISTVESVFEFLLHYNGKKIDAAVKDLSLDLKKVASARSCFAQIDTWPAGLPRQRSQYLAETISTDSERQLIESVIRAHASIAESRDAVRWITLNDDGRLICESEPVTLTQELRVTPGRGWRYDYYVNSMVSIYRGVK